jgi:hypothetical protein
MKQNKTEIKEITSLDPATLGKIMGLITFGLTFLWIIPTQIFFFKEFLFGRYRGLDFIFIWLFLAIFPGFAYIIGILTGYIYNFFAKRFGGLEIELK